MSEEDKLNEYIKLIKETIQTCLGAGDYYGNISFQFNIKGSEINNMNIGRLESVQI